MRQKQQSKEDAKFRTALENMRYRNCTPDDLDFLRTRVANTEIETHPKLAEKRFRNISIITAWNAQKDKINKMGSDRFAEETGQCLTTFYSHDTWAEYESIDDGKKRKRRKKIKFSHSSTNISEDDQTMLWNLEHNATEHIAGKLSLCIGLPVMIRYNCATELCITKGQEGTVVGWDSSPGPYGKEILDTLFVKLTSPPKEIQFEGLPVNVVPITKIASSVKCRLSDDQIRRVDRLQVPVLPNFAMTDYASQGKTRPDNVVDLTNCQSHQSYYTALSRSATAAGTVIVHPFAPGPITGMASGWLRQEFRELELLDNITKLRYKSKLPKHIEGQTRNIQIRQFRGWKGHSYVPQYVHTAIRWSAEKPFDMPPEETESQWKLIEKKNNKSKKSTFTDANQEPFLQAAIGSVPVKGTKRKLEDDIDHNPGTAKKLKLIEPSSTLETVGPLGFVWDSVNWSCAYDSVFTILYSIWTTNPHKWNKIYKQLNPEATLMANSYQKIYNKTYTAEKARDLVRAQLHSKFPEKFPNGNRGTAVAELIREMLRSSNCTQVWTKCIVCDIPRTSLADGYVNSVEHTDKRAKTTSELINKGIQIRHPPLICGSCGGQMNRCHMFVSAPKLLSVILDTNHKIKIDKVVKVMNKNGRNTVLNLTGLVYYDENHFVSRVIDKKHKVWYNDGLTMGRLSSMDGALSNFSNENIWCRDTKVLVAVIYAQT